MGSLTTKFMLTLLIESCPHWRTGHNLQNLVIFKLPHRQLGTGNRVASGNFLLPTATRPMEMLKTGNWWAFKNLYLISVAKLTHLVWKKLPFLYDIFKCISLNENLCIWIQILLKFVLVGQVNNQSSLVQVMVWCLRPSDAYMHHSTMICKLVDLI